MGQKLMAASLWGPKVVKRQQMLRLHDAAALLTM